MRRPRRPGTAPFLLDRANTPPREADSLPRGMEYQSETEMLKRPRREDLHIASQLKQCLRSNPLTNTPFILLSCPQFLRPSASLRTRTLEPKELLPLFSKTLVRILYRENSTISTLMMALVMEEEKVNGKISIQIRLIQHLDLHRLIKVVIKIVVLCLHQHQGVKMIVEQIHHIGTVQEVHQ